MEYVCSHGRASNVESLPGTPAGEALAVFLFAFNTGDRVALRNFIRDRFEASLREEYPGEWYLFAAAIYRTTGGLILQYIEQSTVDKIAAWRRSGRERDCTECRFRWQQLRRINSLPLVSSHIHCPKPS